MITNFEIKEPKYTFIYEYVNYILELSEVEILVLSEVEILVSFRVYSPAF